MTFSALLRQILKKRCEAIQLLDILSSSQRTQEGFPLLGTVQQGHIRAITTTHSGFLLYSVELVWAMVLRLDNHDMI